MEFKGDTFRVWRDEHSNTLHFQGRIRRNGTAEYQPLIDLLDDTVRANPGTMTWDFQELVFINGSGLNVIYRTVLGIRATHPSMNFLVRGCDSIPWQQSALPNIKKLMASARLEFETNPPILQSATGPD
jgi:hypothetical protein